MKHKTKLRLTNNVFCYMKVMPIYADRKYILQVNCIYNTLTWTQININSNPNLHLNKQFPLIVPMRLFVICIFSLT